MCSGESPLHRVSCKYCGSEIPTRRCPCPDALEARTRKSGGQNSNRKRKLKLELLDRGDKCSICGLPVEPKEATLDHVVPRSKGGRGTKDNLKLAHYECNQLKGDRCD